MPKKDHKRLTEKDLKSSSELLPTLFHPPLPSPSQNGEPTAQKALTPEEEARHILYQHSVLCQTCIPYRNPGDVPLWHRKNGMVQLELQAGRVLDPHTDEIVTVGLPFGPKPRLVLYHLNAEAMRTQSPILTLEDSLTAFVKRTLKLDVGGRTIRSVKEQLNRLSAADFRFYASYQDHAVTVKGSVIEGLDLWVSKDERQRVLWPSVVQFSQRYFESLLTHAVPLNESAVSRLSHSAMGLDIYTWLAQRLHRVEPGKPILVPWSAVKEQFGQGYDRMDNFRRVFQTTLKQVAAVYKEARFKVEREGMRLSHSPPPVLKRYVRGMEIPNRV